MIQNELTCELPKGLLQWYDFKKNGKVLYLTDQNDYLKSMFMDKKMEILCLKSYEVTEVFVNSNRQSFDYIIAIGVLERCHRPQKDISLWKQLLKENGTLLLGVDNRLGLRYFCGDKDKYTDKLFDSIENYKRMLIQERNELEGRLYAKSEIIDFLNNNGIDNCKFYSVLPDLNFPQFIYSHDYNPVEELVTRYTPTYNNPDTVYLDERFLYETLIKNGLFHPMANSYIIECPMNGNYTPVHHVTVSMDRGHENAMFTIIREDGKVEKKAAYPEGITKLQQMMENCADLRIHGLNVVDAVIKDNVFVMPYIDAEIATTYFIRLAKVDKNRFIEEVDHFRNLILQSSEHICEDRNDGMGVILKRGYIDLVPLNCFVIDGKYVFYDQEFYEDNCYANLIIYRMLVIIYSAECDMGRILPMDFFIKRYGLNKQYDLWVQKANEFISNLRHHKELSLVYRGHIVDSEVMNTNRQRMNYSGDEYRKIFVEIFNGLGNRKIIVFGSGRFAKRFIEIYKRDYSIYAIVDNNSEKWGQTIDGIPILPPEELLKLDIKEYKVIVCIKNYNAVVKQLKNMGINNIGVYDTSISYKQPPEVKNQEKNNGIQKKYHTGYIAGVFDLFHIGHLNMFKRAKEQCDYLIVGVVTDEAVRRDKNVEPFIPFEERLEIVKSCRYVDKAVEIPPNFVKTVDAYNLYHFDCQFSGSDYVDNPAWNDAKKFLEDEGAELVFFPYTESTSSTKIKEMINKKLV